jgi:hypothetical protein
MNIKEIKRTGYLFSGENNGDCYAWLAALGAYSPIIHLQQTDGSTSDHLPFTAEYNSRGIINGGKVLEALKKAYEAPVEAGMPRRCSKIFLTFEIFTGTAAIVHDAISAIRESVYYWRRWIPRDGLSLAELCGTCSVLPKKLRT